MEEKVLLMKCVQVDLKSNILKIPPTLPVISVLAPKCGFLRIFCDLRGPDEQFWARTACCESSYKVNYSRVSLGLPASPKIHLNG